MRFSSLSCVLLQTLFRQGWSFGSVQTAMKTYVSCSIAVGSTNTTPPTHSMAFRYDVSRDIKTWQFYTIGVGPLTSDSPHVGASRQELLDLQAWTRSFVYRVESVISSDRTVLTSDVTAVDPPIPAFTLGCESHGEAMITGTQLTGMVYNDINDSFTYHSVPVWHLNDGSTCTMLGPYQASITCPTDTFMVEDN